MMVHRLCLIVVRALAHHIYCSAMLNVDMSWQLTVKSYSALSATSGLCWQ